MTMIATLYKSLVLFWHYSSVIHFFLILALWGGLLHVSYQSNKELPLNSDTEHREHKVSGLFYFIFILINLTVVSSI